MVKRILTAALVCFLLVTLFAVPSFAWVNGYLVQGDNSAVFYLPPYATYGIKSEYIPVSVDLANLIGIPLLKFETVSCYEITGTQNSDVYIFQDETLHAPEGHYYGFTMYEFELVDDIVVLEFYVAEYYDATDGEAILVDVIYETFPIETESGTIEITFYAQNVISDATSMPDYFKFFYPYLPMIWTDYAKIINGTYIDGFADGERRGRERINIQEVNKAFANGKAVGYNEGYDDGFYDAGGKNFFKELIDAVVFSPVNAIVEMMNFDFFGINVANFFLALLTILILAGIISLVARFIL